MGLSKFEQSEFKKLKRLIKGTPIKVKRVSKNNSNVFLFGGGFNKMVFQLGGNVGVGVMSVAKARVKISKLMKKAK